ncbi:MAG: hypothetical protein M3527_02815 [Actinomycetota bacterium]|nr:hypothetical protein [Acidimicrobiia bacterium]MDQ3293370.1 hypothetical protein [Actinomycetota bacterium]
MRRLLAFPASILLALTFAACGDDEPLASRDTTTTTEEEEEDNDTTTTTEEESEDTTTTEESDDGGEQSEVCAEIERLGDSEDPETVEELREFIADFNGLRDLVPDDLVDDLEVFQLLFVEVLAEVEENGGDVETALNEVFTSLDEARGAEFQEASEALEQFETDECGGDDDTDTTADTIDDEPRGELGDPTPPPDLDDPEEAELADACFEGDLAACDDLWNVTPVGSDGETYAESCGGRVDTLEQATCEENYG